MSPNVYNPSKFTPQPPSTGNGLSAPKEEDDEHKGKRMHAWVLVRGRKGDPEKTMVFVEPTTGTVRCPN